MEFYEGANLLATLSAAPYVFTWPNVGAGSYTLFARAVDDKGAQTTSTAVNVAVNANQAPAVSLSAPANNALYTAPATITLTASASDADGSVAQIEFLNGATVIATVTAPPYSVAWTNVGVAVLGDGPRIFFTDDPGRSHCRYL